MITVTKQITLNPGVGETGPYVYTWGATTPASGCVSFSPNTTGIIVDPSSQTILTTITFANTTCLEGSVITLTISYNGGECSKQFTITVEDPCEDFEIGGITAQTIDGYTFSISPTGGTGPYEYRWTFDDTYFTQIGSASNVLRLGYIGSDNPPQQSTVWVGVKDDNGCAQLTSVNFAICTLTLDNEIATAVCNPDGTSSVTICIEALGCGRSLIDWNTFQYTSTTAGLTVTQVASTIQCTADGGRRFRIDAASTVPAGTYTIPFTVETSNGIISNTANIYVTVPGCGISGTSTIVISPIAPIQIPCTYSPSDIYYIGPLTSYVTVTGDATIDWDTFHFINMGTGADDGDSTISTLSANVDFNINTLNIEYEIPAGTGTDSFKWTVCDTNGNCAQSQIYAIVLDCVLTPTADDDSECAVCGETAEHDVLANDTINGILFYLDVTTAPTYGTAVFNGSYVSPYILYTPNSTFSGTDTYTYTLTNDSGETDTAEVTVNVLCAGIDANISVCE